MRFLIIHVTNGGAVATGEMFFRYIFMQKVLNEMTNEIGYFAFVFKFTY